MTAIVEKPLPHGTVPFEHIGTPNVKEAVMKLNENIVSLKRQLAEAQRAIIELQRRK